MNADPNWPDRAPGEPGEPDIIILGIDRKAYYLCKGETYLDQLLLADGDFPRPVLCVHFKTASDVRTVIGEDASVARMWGIHPKIVSRLRDNRDLIETES